MKEKKLVFETKKVSINDIVAPRMNRNAKRVIKASLRTAQKEQNEMLRKAARVADR